ncbi:MAG: hypothetical protein RL756_1487, partial [Pseudomonadota bacterium]
MIVLRTALLLIAAALFWTAGSLYLFAPTLVVYGLAHLADLDPDGLSVSKVEWTAAGFTLSGLAVTSTQGARLLHLDALVIKPDWRRLSGKERAFESFRLFGLTISGERPGQALLSLKRLDLENIELDLDAPAVRVKTVRITQGDATVSLNDAGAPAVWLSQLSSFPWKPGGSEDPWRWSIDAPHVEVRDLSVRLDDASQSPRVRVEAQLNRADLRLTGALWDSPNMAL